MKKKILLTIVVVVLACLLACVFVACNKNKDATSNGSSTGSGSSTGGGSSTGETHTHTFAADWTNSESGHWHVCSGEDCDEKSDYAAHD
ncbi:MAG: hypothetical protein ACI4QU_00845, partial [Christensenellales bacterium]